MTALRPEGVWVWTGIHTGTVQIAFDARATAPPVELDGWDDVVEISILAETSELCVSDSWNDDKPLFPSLSTAGPGWYRIRAHVRGRDDLFVDAEGIEQSNERYLLVAWPAPAQDEVSLKVTDARGAETREHW